MPGAVTQAGLPEEVLPIHRIGDAINRRVCHPGKVRYAS
jgi:hypothetical protein